MGPRPIRGLSLCTGIAGIELGLHLALPDYRTVCAVEWDAYAQSILIARQADGAFEPFPIWDDVTTFDGREWRGQVDILSAGYPCQPFSLAGKRAGVDDPRHLWPHVARIIGECQPAVVFLENVPGHLSLGFPDVGMELCALGYGFEAGLFSAAEVGASHNRERLFVLAYAERQRLRFPYREERRTCSFPGDDGQAVAHATSGGWGASIGDADARQPDAVGCSSSLADASLRQFSESGRGQEGRDGARSASAVLLAHPTSNLRRALGDDRRAPSDRSGDSGDVADTDGQRRETAVATAIEYQTRQHCGGHPPLFPPGPGDADAWRAVLDRYPDLAPATESALRGVADGLPRRVDQLKALGNAVVPLVAAHAFRTLRNRLEKG